MAVVNSYEYRFVVDALDLATASERFIAAAPASAAQTRAFSSEPLLTADGKRPSKIKLLLKDTIADASETGASAGASRIMCTCNYPQPPDGDLITAVDTSYTEAVGRRQDVCRGRSPRNKETKTIWRRAKELATNCVQLFGRRFYCDR